MEGGFDEPVTTLKINNVPSHTTEADFSLWFLFARGFQQGTLAPGRGGVQTGWARFETIDDAKVALQTLDGRELYESPEGCVLNVEFAKKNSKPPNLQKKRKYEEEQQSGYGQFDSGQYDAGKYDAGQYGSGQYGSEQYDAAPDYTLAAAPPKVEEVAIAKPAAVSNPSSYDPKNFDPVHFDPTEYGHYPGVFPGVAAAAAVAAAPSAAINTWTALGSTPRATTTGIGSSTLFVGKLAETVTEEEMNQIFPSMHGFERLKFVPPTDGKSAMCFAKFYTPETAQEAMQILAGYRLPSSPQTPLQVEFAKNDLDKPSGRGLGAAAAASAIGGMSAWAATKTPAASVTGMPVGNMGNGECDTMFIGNLSPVVTEIELTRVVEQLHGFLRMKFVSGSRPMAFALFTDVASCRTGIDALHGNALPSAPEQVLLCQFAKNSLDKPTPKFPRV